MDGPTTSARPDAGCALPRQDRGGGCCYDLLTREGGPATRRPASRLHPRAGGRYIYLCASRRPFGRGSAPAVTDVRIQTSSSCPAGWKSPEKFDGLNGDLNQGAGGKDIFMCYKTGNSNSGWEAGDLYSVRVVTGKDAGCPSGSSRVTALDGLDGDLNQNAGGSFIYLCKAPWSQGIEASNAHAKDSYYYYDSNEIGQLLARAYDDCKRC